MRYCLKWVTFLICTAFVGSLAAANPVDTKTRFPDLRDEKIYSIKKTTGGGNLGYYCEIGLFESPAFNMQVKPGELRFEEFVTKKTYHSSVGPDDLAALRRLVPHITIPQTWAPSPHPLSIFITYDLVASNPTEREYLNDAHPQVNLAGDHPFYVEETNGLRASVDSVPNRQTMEILSRLCDAVGQRLKTNRTNFKLFIL